MMAVGSSSWFNPAIRISPEHRAALRRPRSQHRVIEPAKPVANGMHWHLDARLATASRRAQCSCVRRLLHCELVAADAIDPGHQRSTVGIRHVAVIHRLESPSALLLAKRQTAWSCWHCRRALTDARQLASTHVRSISSRYNEVLRDAPVSDDVHRECRGVCDTVLTQNQIPLRACQPVLPSTPQTHSTTTVLRSRFVTEEPDLA